MSVLLKSLFDLVETIQEYSDELDQQCRRNELRNNTN